MRENHSPERILNSKRIITDKKLIPFLIITGISTTFSTIFGYIVLNIDETIFTNETLDLIILLILVLGYFLCGFFTLLTKRMVFSYGMRTRTITLSLGLTFFVAAVLSEFLVMPPEFWDIDGPYRDSNVCTILGQFCFCPFFSWLLGGFLIIYFIYSSNILSKIPIKQHEPLFVDCKNKEKVITVEKEVDITFRIHTKTALSIHSVDLKITDFFKVIEVFGDVPIDLPSKATYSKTFRILAQKVGNTQAILRVKYISERRKITEFYEVSPLKILIRSPPPDLSIVGKLISISSDNQFVLEQPVKLNIQITNIGKGKAKNVQIDLIRLKNRGFKPFTVPKIVSTLPPGHNYIFDIQGIFLRSGKWKEHITVRAKDLQGTEKSWTTGLPMVEILKYLPLLKVTVSNPKAIQMGEIVHFQLQVENVQKGRAKDLVLKWKLPKESTVISGAKLIRIGDLTFNEKKTTGIQVKFTKEGIFNFECSLRGVDIEGIDLPLIKSNKLSIEVIKQAILAPEVIHHPISINTIIDVDVEKKEFSRGTAFTVQKLLKKFDCSEAELMVRVKENLKDKSLFVTRNKDVIKIESLAFNCQICMSSSSDIKFFKCRNCSRNVCWEHFQELIRLGRAICPQCDGTLELLPRICKKCLTDYLDISKKQDYCDFCGHYLSYPPETFEFAKIMENIVKQRKKISQSQIVTFSPKKGDKNNQFNKNGL